MAVGVLFERAVAIEFGQPGATGGRIEDLRIAFRVAHQIDRTPSTAQIRVYNPSPNTVALLRLPGAVVRLFAGYAPSPRMLFTGSPVRGGVQIVAMGADRVLDIDASDGGRGYNAVISVAYSTSTTIGQVLEEVLRVTGWGRGAITIDAAMQMPHGPALVGSASDVMKQVADSVPGNGADWFVRDGALYVVPRGSSTPEFAPLLSSTEGNLIGTPTHTPEGIRVRALIDATMRPGRRISVQSRSVNGVYVVRDAVFTGDSGHAPVYHMDLAARPVGAP